MKEQETRATAPGPTPDESLAHVQATTTSTAAEHQSAELLESMSMPTGQPGATDPAAAQSAEINRATEPTGGGGTGSAPTPGAPAGGGETYTVVRGDSLWKIAERHYGRGAVWRGVYQANATVIGRNSALIHPGQVLGLPTLDAIIATCDHRATVEAAFSLRWNVDVAREAGAARVPIDTFRRMNAQLLLLPPAHVQGTWQRLLHLNDSAGGYMGGGEFGLGENAGAGNESFGTSGLELTEDAAAGATTIKLAATSVVGSGVGLTIGAGTTVDAVSITGVDATRTEFTITPALVNTHAAGTVVGATNNVAREAPWLEAVVRHEMAHAIDGSVVDTTGFTSGLGGWDATNSFDTWAALMGSPWATNDGSVISPAEQAEIKTVIDALRTAPSTAGLDDGLAPEHAIIKYWDKQVPVIEAAKPMAQHGGDYWMHSGEYHGQNGRFFTINDYYEEFHSFNEQVQFNQVRSYATYSAAEFFAEVYSAYYEEAGAVPPVYGRFVPVAAWKTWIDNNVHTVVGAPTAAGAGGPSRGKAAGVSH